MDKVSAAAPDRSRLFARVKQFFGFALSVALLAWLLYVADVRKVANSLAHLSWFALATTVLLGYVAIPVRVVQWQFLLGNQPEASFRKTFRATCLGYLGNFFLPMRGGELVRAYILAKDASLSLGRVLVSVFLSRVQDLAPVGLLVAIVLGTVPITSDAIERTGQILGVPVPSIAPSSLMLSRALATAGVGSVVIIVLAYATAGPLSRRISRWLPTRTNRLTDRVSGFLKGIESGVQVVGRIRLFWGAQLLAAVCWMIYALSPIPLLMAFSMTLTQAFFAALAKAAITSFASVLPSAPGSIGTFHAFCLLSLLIVNPTMDKDLALAYAFVAHLISTLGPALPGLLFLPGAWNELLSGASAVRAQNGHESLGH